MCSVEVCESRHLHPAVRCRLGRPAGCDGLGGDDLSLWRTDASLLFNDCAGGQVASYVVE